MWQDQQLGSVNNIPSFWFNFEAFPDIHRLRTTALSLSLIHVLYPMLIMLHMIFKNPHSLCKEQGEAFNMLWSVLERNIEVALSCDPDHPGEVDLK